MAERRGPAGVDPLVAVAVAFAEAERAEDVLGAVFSAAAAALGAVAGCVFGWEQGRLTPRAGAGAWAVHPPDVGNCAGGAVSTCVTTGGVAVLDAAGAVAGEVPGASALGDLAGAWVVAAIPRDTAPDVAVLAFADPAAAQGALEHLDPLRAVFAGAARTSQLGVVERAYRVLADANLIGMSISTLDGVVDANDAFLAMMGYSRDDLVAGIDWRASTPPEFRSVDTEALATLQATGRSGPYEKVQYARDGRPVVVRIGAALIDKEPLRWAAFVQDLSAERRHLAELVAVHGRLRAELREREEGLAVLQALLVPDLPERVAGVPVAARYLPAYRVGDTTGFGGDWCDTVVGGDGVVHLVIGDVAGSGLAAVAVMAALRHEVRSALALGASPGAALARTDAMLRALHPGWTATACIASYDPTAATVAVVSAGHLPPILRAAGTASLLWNLDAPPLGVAARRGYPAVVAEVVADATIVLYTDGLVEDRATAIDDRLAELARRVSRAPGAPRPCVEEVLTGMLGGSARTDDTCVLAAGLGARQD
jgi:PAS domain S-box-containing protein